MVSKQWLVLYDSNPTDVLRWLFILSKNWINPYRLETKQQSKQWTSKREPTPKKAKNGLFAEKIMATVFFLDAKGILLVDYLRKGRLVPSDFIVFPNQFHARRKNGYNSEVIATKNTYSVLWNLLPYPLTSQ